MTVGRLRREMSSHEYVLWLAHFELSVSEAEHAEAEAEMKAKLKS